MKQVIVIERETEDGWWVVAEGSEEEVWLPRTWLPQDIDVDTVLQYSVDIDAEKQKELCEEMARLKMDVTDNVKDE